MTVSPGGKHKSPRVPGVIVLKGPFVSRHRAEIVEFLRSAEDLAVSTEGADKIERIIEDGEIVVIETTTISFAERIGERLCSVCGGSFEQEPFAEGAERARFTWTRNRR